MEKVEWGFVAVVALGGITIAFGIALWVMSIAVLATTYAAGHTAATACGWSVDKLDAAVEASLKAVGYASLLLVCAGMALVVVPLAFLVAVLLKTKRRTN